MTKDEFFERVENEGLGYTVCGYFGVENLMSIEDNELRQLAVAASCILDRIETLMEDWFEEQEEKLTR